MVISVVTVCPCPVCREVGFGVIDDGGASGIDVLVESIVGVVAGAVGVVSPLVAVVTPAIAGNLLYLVAVVAPADVLGCACKVMGQAR